MQTPESFYDLSCINFGSLFSKFLLFTQIREQLSAIEEVDNKVKFGISLESVVQMHYVRVFNFLENIPFCLGFHEQVLFQKLVFF